MKRALFWLGCGIGALIVLLAIVIAGGYFYFSSRIDQYTPKIEHIASQRLGEPVRINSIDLGWHGFGVEVDLHQVAVLDAKGSQRLISANRVRVDLNPLSFISWPEIHPAFVGVRAPRLTVERAADGSLTIPGLPQGSGAMPTPAEIVTLLNKVGTIAVDDGDIIFNDAKNGIEGWQFTHLDARLEGAADSPQLRLSMSLPQRVGRQLTAQLNLTRDTAGANHWRWQGQAKLAALKLDSLPKLAPVLPLDPHGGAVNVTFSGMGTDLVPEAVQGRVKPLATDARDRTRLSAELAWRNGQGGRLHLAGSDMSIAFPGLFRGPIPLASGDVPLSFKREHGGWRIEIKEFKLANADIAARGHLNLLLPAGGGAPVLDIEARADGIDLKNKSEYLPVGIMPPEVTKWVDESVQSGQVPHVEVVFRGAADQFPFRHGEGLFKVDFLLTDTRVRFQPDWPPVHKLDAHVLFKNEGMSVKATGGTIEGMQIAGTTADIADLAKGSLVIAGDAKGDASQALAFLDKSPIAERFGPYVTKTKASGPLDVDVQLDLPLAHIHDFNIHGKAHLDKVDVTLDQLDSKFRHLVGELDFAKAGLDSPTGLKGSFLGAPVAIAIKNAGNDTTLISLDGSATAAALAKALHAKQTDIAQGGFDWRAQVTLPNEFGAKGAQPLAIVARSDLKGLALTLPAPFKKAADAAVDTEVHFKMLNDGFAVKMHYGAGVQADIHLASAKNGVSIAAGAIHFGAGKPPPVPDSGLAITGYLPRVSLAEWRNLSALIGSGSSTAAPSKIDLDLKIGQVDALGQKFDAVNVKAQSDAAGYDLRLTGPDVAGTILLPAMADNDHPDTISLDRLQLDSNFAAGHAEALNLSPTTLPPIRFVSRDTRLGKRHLGTLKFHLLQAPGGVVLPQFSMALPGLSVNMYGTWIVGDDGVQHTRIAASARSSDLEKAFKALNLPPAITADTAKIDAELHWPGPPSSDIVKRLGGAFNISLNNGKLTQISPGAGRLLALLSLNALPRHLLFNFGDVFGKGFSYDSMGGTFTIINGNAYTKDFRLKSTVADVRAVGRIGLARQDYDEIVIINTAISSTLPIAGAIAGGPVTGAALLLLTQIFKQPLKQAMQLEYHVGGTWDNPIMKKTSVKPEPPLPLQKNKD
ncbi:MAG TPA: YhdP family protein [Gammaproteobacteria bacterium]|nr:YhdP family protein [Gammaproteobacteria bacterium]